MRRLPCSGRCFAGAMMSTHDGSKAVKRASRATRRRALMNGSRESAKSRRSNAPIAAQRRFLPVTADVVRWHLLGRDDHGRDFVMGLYPMLLDETCFFLAADFDKDHWQDDARASRTCLRMDLPAALERSRSGHGGHVWLFFETAVPATLARRLGTHILTETMERRPDIGFDSYDRFFPNQDTLPQRGFGNLIALPLQRQPRTLGRSVFVDQHHNPYPDQWAFLSQVRKIPQTMAEDIVRDAKRRGRIVGVRIALPDDDENQPWATPPDPLEPGGRRNLQRPIADPLPETIDLTLSDQIYIAKDPLPPALRNRLLRLAAFQNPEFYKAQAMRLPTYDKPRIIGCAEDLPHHIGIPRGCLHDVQELFESLHVNAIVHDQRCTGTPLNVTFHGQLQPDQDVAARAMLDHDVGVLAAATAFGKTVIATWLIAQRGVSTLVLVHRRQLLEQWTEHLAALLDLPPKTIGRIGGGRKKVTGTIDVAIIQSLVRKGVVRDQVAEYGHIVVDECHHLPAHSFEQVVRRAKAKFVTGLSATVVRKDGHQPIIFMQCGPVRHRVDAKVAAAARPFQHTVLVHPTPFRPPKAADPDTRIEFHDLCAALIEDDDRNQRICDDVVQAAREGRSPLVLTERKQHLECLAERLAPHIPHLVVLHGGLRTKQARAIAHQLATIPASQQRVLLATGRYIGEGFDDARLDTLFRLNQQLPISFDGWGHMEVDLLSADRHIAIELDGPQHLDSPEAYRRDRRKDQLLQEHGYFVLRFLAEDVRTQLDRVLDTILRALAHRRGEYAAE